MKFPTPVKINTAKLARTIDIVPTILGYLDIPTHIVKGVDLRNGNPEYALLSTRFKGEKKRKAAIVTEKWKYVRDIDTRKDEVYFYDNIIMDISNIKRCHREYFE